MRFAGEGLLLEADLTVSYAIETSGVEGKNYTATCTGERKAMTKAFMAARHYRLRLSNGEEITVRLWRPDTHGSSRIEVLSSFPEHWG